MKRKTVEIRRKKTEERLKTVGISKYAAKQASRKDTK